MTRPVKVIEDDLNGAEAELAACHDRRQELRRELDEARLAEASHPWLGKRVKRVIAPRWKGGSPRTERGTVALYDPEKHRSLRNLGHGMTAGDAIVVNARGLTGYIFNDRFCSVQFELEDGQ